MNPYHFLIPLLASLACSRAASLPHPALDLISNPTLTNLTSTDLGNGRSAVTGKTWWYCTKVETFALPQVVRDDCLGVLDYFYVQTMHDGGTRTREFLAPGATKKTFAEMQWTPVKYTFGTCTLAIVMVQDFPNPTALPGGAKSGPLSDSSTYNTIYTVAQNLVQQCLMRQGAMGWQATGLQHGIGVFIWATGSEEDDLVEADVPALRMVSMGNAPVAGTS